MRLIRRGLALAILTVVLMVSGSATGGADSVQLVSNPPICC
jgi:hypothetical protein